MQQQRFSQDFPSSLCCTLLTYHIFKKSHEAVFASLEAVFKYTVSTCFEIAEIYYFFSLLPTVTEVIEQETTDH
jgi:hypothetical protein